MDIVSIISRRSILLLVLLFCLCCMTTLNGVAQSNALLWLVPVEEKEEFTDNPRLALRLDHASNVYGAEVHLSFEPTILAVVDADEKMPGVQISSGVCPKPGFVARNLAKNQDGTIQYILTQLNPQAPCDEGIVATIEFQCLAPGTSPLRITSSLVLALGTDVIPHTTQDGQVNCQAAIPLIQVYLPIVQRDAFVHRQAYLPLIMHHSRNGAWHPEREENNQLTIEEGQSIWNGIIRVINMLNIPESWRK